MATSVTSTSPTSFDYTLAIGYGEDTGAIRFGLDRDSDRVLAPRVFRGRDALAWFLWSEMHPHHGTA